MRWAKVGYFAAAVASVAVHVAAFGGLSTMKKPEPGTQRVAVMMSAPKKKAKAKPPEPPKPIEAPKEMLQHPLAAPKAAPPPPVAAPPPDPIAAAHPALAAMPDFGISLSGAAGPGGGGIAIPMGGGAAPTPAAAVHKEKVFGTAAERPAAAAGEDCQEDLVKAKPQGFVQPTYTDDARAAGIEGRVRVEVTIDSSGAVLGTKIVSGLGHGLDESAIAAAKRMSFNAATRCGKAVQSTFVISMRFVLGE
jgi:periplasmic protein TonB